MKKVSIIIFLFLGLYTPCLLHAQTNDVGAIGSFSISKKINKSWDLKIEQELRFNQDISTFDRTLTSAGIEYTIIKKLLKAELNYDFIYQNQTDYFEFRQRATAGFSTKLKFQRFDFKFKTRAQMLIRDEDRRDYKYNPKYTWKNKLICDYDIRGLALKPFLSGEIFSPLNGSKGFYLDGIRLVTGVAYRFSKQNSVDFWLRYDEDIQQANPKKVIYGGIGWNHSL